MLKKIVIMMIIILISSSGYSQIYNPPQFPSEEEIEKIQKPTPVISFPRVTFTIGGAVSFLNNNALNEMFRQIESNNNSVDKQQTGRSRL